MNFEKELKDLINKHSMENESNTPDWILAQYLNEFLKLFAVAIQQRDKWYGYDPWAALKALEGGD